VTGKGARSVLARTGLLGPPGNGCNGEGARGLATDGCGDACAQPIDGLSPTTATATIKVGARLTVPISFMRASWLRGEMIGLAVGSPAHRN
jgi:hypothetical protein